MCGRSVGRRSGSQQVLSGTGYEHGRGLVARFCLDRPARALREVSDPLTANDSVCETGVSFTGSVCPAMRSRQHMLSGVCFSLGFLAETDSSPRFVGGFCVAWACRHIRHTEHRSPRRSQPHPVEIGTRPAAARGGGPTRLPRSARSGGPAPSHHVNSALSLTEFSSKVPVRGTFRTIRAVGITCIVPRGAPRRPFGLPELPREPAHHRAKTALWRANSLAFEVRALKCSNSPELPRQTRLRSLVVVPAVC